jgi:putative ABC transport system ATP-binding protein
MIRTDKLTKVFRTDEVETTALNEVDFNVEQGEFVAIMGPSGCGKSTLLHIIGLLDSPSNGRYYFIDKEVSRYTENQMTDLRKGNIGFIFQSFNLIDELNVYENVELPLLYLRMSSKERKKKVNEVLDRMQLSHRKNHFPQQLSGGQQQRVAVARAVVTNPKILLADEPTGNLDSVNGEEVIKLLEELNNEGTTIVMVTHSPAHAQRANRVVQLFDGRIITENILKEF